MFGLIPAAHFVKTLDVNVDNDKLTDEAFREMVRNTLPIVQEIHNERQQVAAAKRREGYKDY